MPHGYRILEEAVDSALYLENSKVMRSVVLFRLLCSFIAIVLMTSVYSYVRNMRAHKGLVLLLHIHYFWTHSLCCCSLFDAALMVYKSCSWKADSSHFACEKVHEMRNPEDLLNDGTLCFFRKIPYSVTMCGGAMSILAIVIERQQASVHVRTYEGTGLGMALRLGAFQAVYVLGVFLGSLALYDFHLNFSFCSPVTPKTEKFMEFIGVNVLLIQLFARIAFGRLLRRNSKFLQQDKESLSERYQIKENIHTLKLLVPLVDTQFILNFFPVVMWLLYTFIPHGFDPRAVPIFEECINVVQLYGIIMPLLILDSQRRNQQRVKEEFSMNNNAAATDNHLKKIQLNW